MTFDCDPPRVTCAPLILQLDTNSPVIKITIAPVPSHAAAIAPLDRAAESADRIEGLFRVLKARDERSQKELEAMRRYVESMQRRLP